MDNNKDIYQFQTEWNELLVREGADLLYERLIDMCHYILKIRNYSGFDDQQIHLIYENWFQECANGFPDFNLKIEQGKKVLVIINKLCNAIVNKKQGFKF